MGSVEYPMIFCVSDLSKLLFKIRKSLKEKLTIMSLILTAMRSRYTVELATTLFINKK